MLVTRFTKILIFFFLAASSLSAQNNDSLLNLLKSSAEDTSKVILLNKIASGYTYSDAKKGLGFARQATDLAKRLDFKREEARSLCSQGVFYMLLGDLRKAEDSYREAEKLFIGLKNRAGIAFVAAEIGGIYFQKELYDQSLEQRLKALRIYRELKDRVNEAASLSNMAIIFARMQQFSEAEKYFNQTLALKRDLGDKRGESITYTNLGAMWFDQQQWEKALGCFQKALALQETLNDIRIIVACKTNLANIYMRLRDYSLSLKMNNDCYEIYRQYLDTAGMAITQNGIGAVYAEMGNYPAAISAHLNALHLLEHVQDHTPLKATYSGLHDAYKKSGDYKSALAYLEKAVEMERNTYTEEVAGKIAKQKEQYEAEKREQDILLLEEKNTTTQVLAEKRKLYVILAISIGLLFISLLLLFLVRTNSRKKQREIELARDRMQFEQKALRAQMNPHFIFNALNSIQHYILSNETQVAYDYLARFSKLIRQVLINSEYNTISLKKEIELLELYIELEQRRFKNRFEYSITYSKNLPVEDIVIPVMLIQPFVENAIWHGIMNLDETRKGTLRIGMELNGNTLAVSIEDNGVGRKQAAALRSDHSHESVGILFSEKRLEALRSGNDKGRIEISDLVDEKGSPSGTKVLITIPIEA